MWVAESARGLGVGRQLLGELEKRAAKSGARAVRLETNRSLAEAISLYRSAGYAEVSAFNTEAYAHHWFEKQVGGGREFVAIAATGTVSPTPAYEAERFACQMRLSARPLSQAR